MSIILSHILIVLLHSKHCISKRPVMAGLIHVHNEQLLQQLYMYVSCMSTALSVSSVILCFEHSNMIEICDEIKFVFYPVLPHIIPWHSPVCMF